VNSSRRAALPLAPHHRGIVRSPRLYHYDRTSKKTHSASFPIDHNEPISSSTTATAAPLSSNMPSMTRSAPLSTVTAAGGVAEDTTPLSEMLATAPTNEKSSSMDINDVPTPLSYDPFARGFDIVRSSVTDDDLDQYKSSMNMDGSQTSRPRRVPRPPLSLAHHQSGNTVTLSAGNQTARSYYHTNWLRKDAF
jgi:hypothetical protein